MFCNGFIERLQDENPSFDRECHFLLLKWGGITFPLPWGKMMTSNLYDFSWDENIIPLQSHLRRGNATFKNIDKIFQLGTYTL